MTDETSNSGDRVLDDAVSMDEPIDAEFREAEPAVPAKPAKRGPGWISTFLMMMLATGGGGALGYYGAERMPGLLGGETAAALPSDLVKEARLAEMEVQQTAAIAEVANDVQSIERNLARLEGGVEAMQASADDDLPERVAALTARLDAIETLPTTDGAPVDSAITRSLASAIARIDRLEARLTERDTALAGDIGGLRDDLSELVERVNAIPARDASRGNTLAEAALALSTIDAAARRGQDFSAAFAVLQRARPDSPAVREIAPIAARGAPTLEQLKSSYTALSLDIETRLEQQGGQGAASAANRLFGDLVSVRSPETADDFAALDEARIALDRDDLAGAATALSRLEGEAATLTEEWIGSARARRTLERALDTLRLDLMVEEQTPAGAP